MLPQLLAVALSIVATSPQTFAQSPVGDPTRGETVPLKREEFLRELFPTQPYELFVPRQTASESDKERTHSLALFGKARLRQQRGDFEKALASFQRAHRWNPAAPSILDEIVPLAFLLERQEVGIRYAVLANEQSPGDPELIQQLAMMLAADEEYDRALNLLDAGIRNQPEPSLLLASLHFDRARVCLFHEAFERGVASLDVLRQAMSDPDQFGTTAEILHEELGEKRGLHRLMAEIYLQAGRISDAATAFEELDRENNSPALRSFHLALLANEESQWDTSLEELESYFQLQSSAAGETPYELLEEALIQKLGDDRGLKEFSLRLAAILADDPANTPLSVYIARRLHQRNQTAEVVKLLQPLADGSLPADALEMLLAAQVHRGNPAPIIANLYRLTRLFAELDGPNVLPITPSIEQLAGDGELMQKVLIEAKMRLKDRRRPMVPVESFALAQLCLRAERLDDATPFIAHALDNSSGDAQRHQVRIAWAEACYFADQWTPAIEGFEQALKQIPKQSETGEQRDRIVAQLVAALELNGQTQRALQVADKFLAESSDSATLMLRRAWVYRHADQKLKAIDAYRSMTVRLEGRYESEFVRQYLKDARSTLSSLYAEQGDEEAAEELLLRILDEYPEDTGARNDLGYLWADRNVHLEKSLRMIQKAVEAEPENAAYLDSLGWVFFRLQRYDQALPPLQEAAKILKDEPDGIILNHLGDVYNSLSDRENALAAWRQAVAIFSESNDEQDVRQVESKIQQLK